MKIGEGGGRSFQPRVGADGTQLLMGMVADLAGIVAAKGVWREGLCWLGGLRAGLIEIDWLDGRRGMVGRVDGHITHFADLRADTESPGEFTEAVPSGERGRGEVGAREGRVALMMGGILMAGGMNKVGAAAAGGRVAAAEACERVLGRLASELGEALGGDCGRVEVEIGHA